MGPADQPAYVNAVCELKTSLDALQLLDALQAIELSHGRIRQGKRWGPRTLDLDILLYGDNVINEDRLEIPHPGITLRSFVLIPLLEIAPKIEIPKLGHAAAYRESVEMYGIVKMDVPLET